MIKNDLDILYSKLFNSNLGFDIFELNDSLVGIDISHLTFYLFNKFVILSNGQKCVFSSKFYEKHYVSKCDMILLIIHSPFSFNELIVGCEKNSTKYIFYLQSLIVDYLQYEIQSVEYNNKVIDILESLCKERNHSLICNSKTNEIMEALKKDILKIILPYLEDRFLKKLFENNENCLVCSDEKNYRICLLIMLCILSWIPNLEILDDKMMKFNEIWKIPKYNHKLIFIYRNLENPQDNLTIQELLNDDFSVKLLSLLSKCTELKMNRHLNSVELTNVQQSILFQSCFTLNVLLSEFIDFTDHFTNLPLNCSVLKNSLRQILKSINNIIIKDFSAVLSKSDKHYPIIIKCLKRKLNIEEIFNWFCDCELLSAEYEEELLTQLSPYIDKLCSYQHYIALLNRINLVHKEGRPISKFVNMAKSLLNIMSDSDKIKVIYHVYSYADLKNICNGSARDGSLRKCSNQLSGDTDTYEDVENELEFLLILYPYEVVNHLLKLCLYDTFNTKFIYKILSRISYIFNMTGLKGTNHTLCVLVDCLNQLLFHSDVSIINPHHIDLKLADKLVILLQKTFEMKTIQDQQIMFDQLLSGVAIQNQETYPSLVLTVIYVFLSDKLLSCSELWIGKNQQYNSLLIWVVKLHYTDVIDNDSIASYIPVMIDTMLMGSLSQLLDKQYIVCVVDKMRFGPTKLKFYEFYKANNIQFIIPQFNNIHLLNSQVLNVYRISMQGNSSISSPIVVSDKYTNQIEDIKLLVQLSCASVALYKIVVESVNGSAWSDIDCNCVSVALLELMAQSPTSTVYTRAIDLIRLGLDRRWILWLYQSQSTYSLNGVSDEWMNILLILDLLKSTLSCSISSGNLNYISTCIRMTIDSLLQIPDLVQSDCIRAAVSSHCSDSPHGYLLIYEVMQHLLDLYGMVHNYGSYAGKSISLIVQSWMAVLSLNLKHIPSQLEHCFAKLKDLSQLC